MEDQKDTLQTLIMSETEKAQNEELKPFHPGGSIYEYNENWSSSILSNLDLPEYLRNVQK
jgi:hypothetical protein